MIQETGRGRRRLRPAPAVGEARAGDGDGTGIVIVIIPDILNVRAAAGAASQKNLKLKILKNNFAVERINHYVEMRFNTSNFFSVDTDNLRIINPD